MKNILFTMILGVMAMTASAQNVIFDEQIEITDYESQEILLPPSPLTTQVLFIGGYDIVQTTATYGRPAGRAIAKEWHDFIGFTPDVTGASLGWVSVNHEQIYEDDRIGDGGGMTTFRIQEGADGLDIMEQTLDDGRQGHFFNVDFVNTVGETGMNCAGISAPNGRIWTAEEWFRSSQSSINNGVFRSPDRFDSWNPHNPASSSANKGVRDTTDFTIDTPEFPEVDGMTIKKYENFNYMVEIDPIQAVAIRKQYNWGRGGWEGGAITADGQTVYLGMDATPAPWVKYEADTPWDFTNGTLYVYKGDNAAGSRWIAVPQTADIMLGGLSDYAWSVGATMFNRNEWVTIDQTTGIVYWTETGRDNPGSRWSDEADDGGTYAAHHMARAAEQGVANPGESEYWDYYGRVLYYDPATEYVGVTIEGGPYMADGSPSVADYPNTHLSNPDGLNVMVIDGQSFLMIQEDLNGTSFGRTPEGISNRLCELFLLSTAIENPTLDDLIRISAIPAGAEITGAIQISNNTILVNSQHPNANNPFPYNHSITMAIHGFADLVVTETNSGSVALDQETDVQLTAQNKTAKLGEDGSTDDVELSIYPNPTSREIFLSEAMDFAIYDVTGKRIKVYRNRNQADVSYFGAGTYFLQTAAGKTYKFIVQE